MNYELEAKRLINTAKQSLARVIELHPYHQDSQAEQDCLAAMELLNRINLNDSDYTQIRKDEKL